MTPITVTRLSVAAVKGLRLTPREELMLDRSGVREDRRFYLVDDRGRMINAKHIGTLTTVVADYDDRRRYLSMSFPGGEVVVGNVELGSAIDVRFYSRESRGRPVLGPWSEALSDHFGEPLRLVEADSDEGGVDRGRRGAVSLISGASLRALARVAELTEVDPRRFRMLVEIDGVTEHEEDAWVGRRLQIGDAVVGLHGHVGRCVITSQDPDRGDVDLPTLDLLRSYRAGARTTEPLPFGVYGEVLVPGQVRTGDPVTPLDQGDG